MLSKLYYQLGEYNESMTFALNAGSAFNPNHMGEYEETIIAKCIDTYIALSAIHNPPPPPAKRRGSSEFGEGSWPKDAAPPAGSVAAPFSREMVPSKSLLSRDDGENAVFDSATKGHGNGGVQGAHPEPLMLPGKVQKALKGIVNGLFKSCYETGAYRQVVGIAVEARNMEVLKEAITRCARDEKGSKGKKHASMAGQTEELMEYVLDICMNVVQERGLRNDMLKLILDLLREIPSPDYFAIARCVVYLDQYTLASDMLRQLVQKGDGKSLAIAYQLSFDLYENGTQEFLSRIMEELPETEETEQTDLPQGNGEVVQPATPVPNEDEGAAESSQLLSELQDSAGPPSTSIAERRKQKPESEDEKKRYASVRSILRGTTTIQLTLEFLFRNSHSDKAILHKVRDSLEARNSIFHTAVTFANAFMNAGTTIDSFFRENLEWLGKAVNWSKFTATAALGVIHRGNIGQGQKLLEPYLPKEGGQAASQGSVYSQGGSLFALGLIYTNHGTHVLDYLRRQFKATQEEVVQHGGALGLGVAGMATGDEAIYDELKQVLYQDSAINGEAVGLSMGLVMLGTGNNRVLEDMLQYAHDTQHEKIVRGLALGMAVLMYGKEELVDDLVAGQLEDANPALRYGGVLTIAMAYCGSGSNRAVRRLLHTAVSDVSDDVRRVAVMSLGFVLFRKPGSVPRMVELLAESYNPHVRYGAAMALGIACAGTGLEEAVELLEPMVKDSVDFVRQGALIALAMILIQQNSVSSPKVDAVRKNLLKMVGDRHEDAMTKFGCALALGILDAGGRNCTIGLQTQTGNLNMPAIVGMLVFTQYWYWFPLTHFLSLAFTPTSVIGLSDELEVVEMEVHCAGKQSLFEYPPEQTVKVEAEVAKVETAVLSTTKQAKRRKLAKDREAKTEGGDMDVDRDDAAEPEKEGEGADEEKMDVDAEEDVSAEAETKEKETEKVGFEVPNMSRVLPSQVKFLRFAEQGRWRPVKKVIPPSPLPLTSICYVPTNARMYLANRWRHPPPGHAAAPAQAPARAEGEETHRPSRRDCTCWTHDG